MSLEKRILTEMDEIFIRDGGKNLGCGSLNEDGQLYLIDREKMEAYRLPDQYQDTPLIRIPPCGGYKDGLIMVSLLGEIDLQYHHPLFGAAGMWGWIDLDGNEVIPPQYPFALHFSEGKAVVCKGVWTKYEDSKYWCEKEQWGIIDRTGTEWLPCQYDDVYWIDGTSRFFLCHKGGWKDGRSCIYDVECQCEIVEFDFNFDNEYMFNDCFYDNGHIIFGGHRFCGKVDYLYAYAVKTKEWLVYHEPYEKRELNGKTKIVIDRDGEEFIVF